MQLTGTLQKMHTSLESGEAKYLLPIGENSLKINDLVGQKIELNFNGQINCANCSRLINKSYSQGYCFPCCQQLARCDLCMMRPQTCHYHLGTCREPDWGLNYCFSEHIVYLANSSGVKVGITHGSNTPSRWIDQGAVSALPILAVDTRIKSGQIEIELAKSISDKTNWRKMLTNQVEYIDLVEAKNRLLDKISAVISVTNAKHIDAQQLTIKYPVINYPEKVKSLNFDKTPNISGTLQGIKGQYLILDCGVLNIRKFSSYNVSISY